MTASNTYAYFWAKDIIDEWSWTECFAPQPETKRYRNFVADKFDLCKDIPFNSRVAKGIL